MTNEEKAKIAATEFCRCYKCDKIAHNVISEYEPAVTFKCDKSKLSTPNQSVSKQLLNLVGVMMLYALIVVSTIDEYVEEFFDNLHQRFKEMK